jgi:hypothetical protein
MYAVLSNFNALKLENLEISINPVRTSQETLYVSAATTNRLMPFRGIFTV